MRLLDQGYLEIVTTLFLIGLLLAWLTYLFMVKVKHKVMELIYALNTNYYHLGGSQTETVMSGSFAKLEYLILNLKKSNCCQGTQHPPLEIIINEIFSTFPVPVCVFDAEHKLLFGNKAMFTVLKKPMLIASSASSLGFEYSKNIYSNQVFSDNYWCQTTIFNFQDKQYRFFTAADISFKLNQTKVHSQDNIVRVLSHELRNSLTPLYSLSDTLLSSDTLEEVQVRNVLTKMNERSKTLLSFINSYSKLKTLPSPIFVWFNLQGAIDEALLGIDKSKYNLVVIGVENCFGDKSQITQLLTNLFKNSIEAKKTNRVNIKVESYVAEQQQFLKVNDNGIGFINFKNVLTPFYTTKKNGSGIGLALCNEIIQKHNGKLFVNNDKETGGACILMCWKLRNK